MFGIVLTGIYTILLLYVFWCAASVRLLGRHISRKLFIGIGTVFWAVFSLARFIGHNGTRVAAATMEFAGMTLLGWVFLTATVLLVVELVTAFVLIFYKVKPKLRGLGLIIGMLLTAVALFQGLRAPAVVSYDVTLPNLPPRLNGTVLVALSDAHLGSYRGERWFTQRMGEIQALGPQIVVFLGDVFEGHGAAPSDIPALRSLSVPMGKWFVDGNHELHGDVGASDGLLEKAGFIRLDNRWAEPAPGLILAGVKDLTHQKHRSFDGNPLGISLANRPSGATVLLSHTPWQADRAAHEGVELMLSGHTHGGQIWPFGYLVKTTYPLLAGRYDIDGMPIIVTRGIGTWGPRMRLWYRGEILKVTLHTPLV